MDETVPTLGPNTLALVSNPNGCSDTSTTAFFVIDKPTSLFSYTELNNTTVELSNVSLNSNNNFEWYVNGGLHSNDVSTQLVVTYNGSYEIELIAANNCSIDTSMQNITFNNVGLQDKTSSSISVYPNPVDRFLTVKLNGEHFMPSTIKIFSSIGAEVYQKTTNASSTKIDLSNLESGLYFGQINLNNNSTKFSFIKL